MQRHQALNALSTDFASRRVEPSVLNVSVVNHKGPAIERQPNSILAITRALILSLHERHLHDLQFVLTYPCSPLIVVNKTRPSFGHILPVAEPLIRGIKLYGIKRGSPSLALGRLASIISPVVESITSIKFVLRADGPGANGWSFLSSLTFPFHRTENPPPNGQSISCQSPMP